MAGGNSHDRRIFNRAVQKETTKRLAEIGVSVLLAFIPWGQGMIHEHPCMAWLIWVASAAVAIHVTWVWFGSTHKAVWGAVAFLLSAILVSSAYVSLKWRTKPQVVFLEPGVALNGGIEWTLHTTARINRPIFHLTVNIDDQVTARAVPNEPDESKRIRMIRGSHVSKTFEEVDPNSPGDASVDFVVWKPIAPDQQEYNFSSSYRVGEETVRTAEILKIVNRSYAMRVVDYDHKTVLMECRDTSFPIDSDFSQQLPPCFPNYPTVLRWLPGCLS